MAEMPKYFDNVTIGQFALTGVPLKVYVDGVYLTITDPDDIEDPLYGFGMDDDGAVHSFDYRMIDHLLVANQHLDFATYVKAMTPKAPEAPKAAETPKEEPKKEEPKKEESVMKLKSLIEKNIKRKSGKLNEDISADKKKLADLKKDKTKLAKDIATLTLKVADQEAAAAEAGVTESITDLSEPYTIQVGGMVQNINPNCMHYGSMGTVDKMIDLPGDVGTVVKYTVTNDGDTFSTGDTLIKTMDQLIPVDDMEMDDMYDDDSDEMDDWEVTNIDGLDDEDYEEEEEEDDDDDEDYGEVVDDEDEEEEV